MNNSRSTTGSEPKKVRHWIDRRTYGIYLFACGAWHSNRAVGTTTHREVTCGGCRAKNEHRAAEAKFYADFDQHGKDCPPARASATEDARMLNLLGDCLGVDVAHHARQKGTP